MCDIDQSFNCPRDFTGVAFDNQNLEILQLLSTQSTHLVRKLLDFKAASTWELLMDLYLERSSRCSELPK